MFETQRKAVVKVVHSTLGAPVVARRIAEEYYGKATEYADKLVEHAQARYDESATEGEKIAKRFQDGAVVDEIQQRVDMDKVQDRVGKLRDQLEAALDSWRENFTPGEVKAEPKKVEVESAKPAAKKAPAKKAPAKKTAAAKKPAAKTTATKKAPAKKAPAKKTTAAKSTAAKKPAAKKTTTTRKPATTAKK